MKIVFVALITFGLIVIGCKENNITEPKEENLIQQFSSSGAPGDFGVSTSIVVYVNPKINMGTTGNIEMGTIKEGITVNLENQAAVLTNAGGVAVLKNVPVRNNLPVYINGSVIYVDVSAKYDQYDVIVKYKDDTAEVIKPVRIKYSEKIKISKSHNEFNSHIKENDLVILLDTLLYEGNIEISGNNIVIIGKWDLTKQNRSVLKGNVTVTGNDIKIINLEIEGALVVRGNNFEISYSRFNTVSVEREDVVVLRNYVAESSATVTAEKVLLLDNDNLQ